MKIGFVLYDYYPFGGLQEDCLATALATHKRGHEVYIFTRTWKGEKPEGIVITLFKKKGWSNTSRNKYFFSTLQVELPNYHLDGIVAFNRIPNADIYFAADPCFKERKSHLAWWQKLSLRYRYYSQLEATVFRGANAPETLVLTEREANVFQKHYRVPNERFHLLPPGVAPNHNSQEKQNQYRQNLRKELGTLKDAAVALFVGSGFRIKGLDRALRAIEANRNETENLEFWVVGNGNAGSFKLLAEKTGLTVRFLGGRADTDRFYAAADFLLHPAYSESAGKVLLEALTHGLPVLTTDTCGYAPHILKAKAGAVIESPFSQQALNEMVRTFIQDRDKRQQMSQNGLAYAANEDLYTCHQAAAKIIERVLTKTASTNV
jgi:UDP-glucose:(heptosyl)LPS alpha-1,3-glucosyltransferase